MALTATLYHWKITLSDVERGVYESIDLRIARHPSESLRYLVTRAIAYALSYEEGIAFSKGGISSTDEAPVFVRDLTGALMAWFEIGSPSAERLHKAAKAAPRVALFTAANLDNLRAEADAGAIHRAHEIMVWQFDPAFLDSVGERLERTMPLELVYSSGRLYVTIGKTVLEGEVACSPLTSAQ